MCIASKRTVLLFMPSRRFRRGISVPQGNLTAITPDNNPVNKVHISSGNDQYFSVLEAGSETKTSKNGLNAVGIVVMQGL